LQVSTRPERAGATVRVNFSNDADVPLECPASAVMEIESEGKSKKRWDGATPWYKPLLSGEVLYEYRNIPDRSECARAA
jgi:hypothetical protein